ncbi:hypothetical protein AHF37_09729 [Paragonimus kellicotti]|nr:hypothetical protein AHF37_09729 [Paragonimus kellicotti]
MNDPNGYKIGTDQFAANGMLEHQYTSSKDWMPVSAHHILPSDYPAYAPTLFSKSLRAFFAKRISGFGEAPLSDRTVTTDFDGPSQSVAAPARGSHNLNAVDEQVAALRRTLLKRSFSLVPERLDGVATFAYSNLPLLTDRSMLHCEHILAFLSCFFVLLGFPFSLAFCLRVIPQYERAVIFRLGRLTSKVPAGPGLVFILPCLDTVQRVDLRTFTFDVPTQEVLTSDSVTVAVNAVVYYRIFDPVMSVVNVKNVNWSTRLLAQTTLRNVLGTVDMCALLTDREHIAALMQETLDAATDTWGMKVERVEIKDVRLPIQLQRTLAAEAEATREAKAKVIAAQGEKDASRSLREAAMEIGHCPVALQLRYLQALSGISAEHNSTIIFPLPMEILTYFRAALSFRGCERRSSVSLSGMNDEFADVNLLPVVHTMNITAVSSSNCVSDLTAQSFSI